MWEPTRRFELLTNGLQNHRSTGLSYVGNVAWQYSAGVSAPWET
jgi:hypothetical protein